MVLIKYGSDFLWKKLVIFQIKAPIHLPKVGNKKTGLKFNLVLVLINSIENIYF